MAKIYDKGQVTIPKHVRDESGLTIGDHVLIEARGTEVVIRKPTGVLEFEAPQSDRDAPPWPNARRAARDARVARRAGADQR